MITQSRRGAERGSRPPRVWISASLRLCVSLLLLSACAATDGILGLEPGPGLSGLDPLTQLAESGLIAAVLEDAAATLEWVEAQERAGMDPVKVTLARACPLAAQFAATDFRDKVLGLKSLLDQVGVHPVLVNLAQPRLMLRLTLMKYGSEPSLEERIAALRADLALRLDALFTGCAHLFPRRQVQDLAILAGKSGLLSTGGGGLLRMLAP